MYCIFRSLLSLLGICLVYRTEPNKVFDTGRGPADALKCADRPDGAGKAVT
jgi:hypothetical protein